MSHAAFLDLALLALLCVGLCAALWAALPALAPSLAPIWRAFAHRPALNLAPGERVVLTVRPDRGLLSLIALALAVGLAAFQAGLVLMGGDPGQALALTALPAVALGAALVIDSRKLWLVTDRRILTGAGATLALSSITRLALAPATLRIEARGGRGLTMLGLSDPARLAQALAQSVAQSVTTASTTPPHHPAQTR